MPETIFRTENLVVTKSEQDEGEAGKDFCTDYKAKEFRNSLKKLADVPPSAGFCTSANGTYLHAFLRLTSLYICIKE